MPKPVVLNQPVKFAGQILSAGSAEIASSGYLLHDAVADLFVSMGWGAHAPDAVDPVDLAHLELEPGTIRHSDGAVIVPHDISPTA